MKRLNSFRHNLLFGVACAAILAVFVLSAPGNGYSKTTYDSHNPPETTEHETRSEEEKIALQADFENSLESKAYQIKDDVTGSKLFAVAVTGLSKNVDLGKRIFRGDYLNGYPVKEDSVVVNVPAGFEAAVVKRVVDGDTLFCEIIGSNNPASDIYEMAPEELETSFPCIRLYGVNTEESEAGAGAGYVESATEMGKAASEYMKDLIEEGQIIWLSPGEEDKDKYDRYLRMVWLEEPSEGDTDSEDAIAKKTAQGKLLLDGMAEILFVGDNTKYMEWFTSFQSEAMKETKGLWELAEPENRR